MPELQDYLGDAVYAEFDGFGIWLRANAPDSPKEVYLEPEVLAALNRFADRCRRAVEETKRKGKDDAKNQVQGP